MKYANSPVYISTEMVGKMKGLWAISTTPLLNPFCMKMSKCKGLICEKCYSIFLCKGIRAHVVEKPYTENYKVLSEKILDEKELPRFNRKFKVIRFTAHGELINDINFINFVNICNVNPTHTFALWTKRTDIINRNHEIIPDNLILIYSTPKVDHVAELPKYFHRTFNVFTADYALDNNIKVNCHGNAKKMTCKKCGICYSKENKTEQINEVLKFSQKKYYRIKEGKKCK